MDSQYYEIYWQDDTAVPDSDPTTAERNRRLADAVRALPKGHALDLGCGRGQFTAYLHSLGYDAIGMDLSANAIEKAKAAHPDCKFNFLRKDGTIPADDESFDLVWSTEVIEHVFDVGLFLAEVERVLKPGGHLILTTPYHGLLKNLLVCLVKFDSHFDPEGPHIRFFDKAGLKNCLSKAGLEPMRWQGVGRVPWLWRTWFVSCQKPKAYSDAA